MNTARRTWGKRIGVTAMVITLLGMPWAGLIWLSGGMKSVPLLTLEEVGMASPPLILSFILALISFRFLKAETDLRPMRRRMIIVMILVALAMTILIATYFDTKQVRFLK
jgi:hypothetical protein